MIAELKRQHRQIEAAMERGDSLREALVHHYGDEEAFLALLAVGEPEVASKLRAQHEEALEILGHLETASPGDEVYLKRRLVAIVQHNIIEEERDIFPRYMPSS